MRYAIDPVKYFIDMELIRYLETISYIYKYFNKNIKILDIGFFIPVVPLSLKKLGYNVTSIEKLDLYEGALDNIIKYATNVYSVNLIDINCFDKKNIIALKEKFDLVLLLAVLEHLNGSPRYLLNNIYFVLKNNGILIGDVPNVAQLRKRLYFFIKGKLPFSPFEDYFYSEYPYSGHNREYSIEEVKFALKNTGFEVINIKTFHHSLLKPKKFLGRLLFIIEKLGPSSWKPTIWFVAKKSEHKI